MSITGGSIIGTTWEGDQFSFPYSLSSSEVGGTVTFISVVSSEFPPTVTLNSSGVSGVFWDCFDRSISTVRQLSDFSTEKSTVNRFSDIPGNHEHVTKMVQSQITEITRSAIIRVKETVLGVDTQSDIQISVKVKNNYSTGRDQFKSSVSLLESREHPMDDIVRMR